MWSSQSLVLVCLALGALACTPGLVDASRTPRWPPKRSLNTTSSPQKDTYIDSLIAKMAIEDLVLQLHLMFADDIVGKYSNNELYESTMQFSPESPIGVMHDWYPMNKSYFNSVQNLTLEKAHLPIPMMLVEECLHGVGSFKQSIFPQQIGMAASFDTDIVYRVGRAIGTEARSIGVHGCFSPVLDLAQDPRWGRAQEDFGEDKILTSHIGVAYASGLSKNSSWSDPDAVFPIMKHFAAHGAPQAGHNTAPFMGHGNREVLENLLVPFKAVADLGGARGVMMAYNELDDVPAAVNEMLYGAMADWGFDGLKIADDTCMRILLTEHRVADSQASAMEQWFNAGGMIQYYDWSLESYLSTTKDLVANGSVPLATLQSHVRTILGIKWDLGLFENPYIPDDIDPLAIVASHVNLTLEAAQKSIVLLKNDNQTLPLLGSDGTGSGNATTRIALVGPYTDVLNFGDYAGQWGQYPIKYASTIRQGMLESIQGLGAGGSSVELVSSWGANTWEYNAQYAIPPYLLSTPNGTAGGLLATYYTGTDFIGTAAATRVETPAMDWGLYPPPGLPSSNFSATWEGELQSPVDAGTPAGVNGWIGIAIGANTTASLFIDGTLVASSADNDAGDVVTNIEPFSFVQANGTLPPQGGAPFTFLPGARHSLRIEYQTWNLDKKYANIDSINSQVMLWWNLVSRTADPVAQAASAAASADVVVLTVGASWNSDAEGGDRAKLDLCPAQDALAEAVFATGKPVVLVLEGGRPFAIPQHYDRAAAVLSTYFAGQSGGRAIADVLFGAFNPGGRLPITVPYHVGQIPAYYNYKPTARAAQYLDIPTEPIYPFGYGLSYTTFEVSSFAAAVTGGNGSHGSDAGDSFSSGEIITFSATVRNNGTVAGSYVAQVYLLGRVSTITQPVKQLVAFQRIYLDAGQQTTVSMDLDVDRYLMILNRKYQWELEPREYPFALLENGATDADTSMNITLACV